VNILPLLLCLPRVLIPVTCIAVVCLWRSKTGVVQLDQTLKYIMGITVQSAALPCTCMVVAVALYRASPVSLSYTSITLSATHRFTAYEGPPHTILRFIDGKALLDRDVIHVELKSNASRTDEVERVWPDVPGKVAMGSGKPYDKKLWVTLRGKGLC
jgi:hypothetical protein